MPCIPLTDGNKRIGILCTPTYIKHSIRILYCPKCKQRRKVKLGLEEWYGWSGTCKAKRKWRNGHEVICDYYFASE